MLFLRLQHNFKKKKKRQFVFGTNKTTDGGAILFCSTNRLTSTFKHRSVFRHAICSLCDFVYAIQGQDCKHILLPNSFFRGDLGKNAKTAVCASGPLLHKEHASSSLYFISAVKRSVVKPTVVSDSAGLFPHTRYLLFFPGNSVLVR